MVFKISPHKPPMWFNQSLIITRLIRRMYDTAINIDSFYDIQNSCRIR